MSDSLQPRIRLTADIGRAFTDVSAFERTGAFSFAGNQSTLDSLVDGVGEADPTPHGVGFFRHGSTIAIDTAPDGSGAGAAELRGELTHAPNNRILQLGASRCSR